MSSQTSTITQLLPFLGVVVGGIIALVSTLSAIYLGFNLELKKDDRKVYREKLERAYIILYQIRHDYVDLMGQCQAKINYGTDFHKRGVEVPSPLSEIDMLIKLYIPSLQETHKEFQKIIESFGKILVEVVAVKFSQMDDYTKQSLSIKVASTFSNLEEEIKSFQDKIASKISDTYRIK